MVRRLGRRGCPVGRVGPRQRAIIEARSAAVGFSLSCHYSVPSRTGGFDCLTLAIDCKTLRAEAASIESNTRKTAAPMPSLYAGWTPYVQMCNENSTTLSLSLSARVPASCPASLLFHQVSGSGVLVRSRIRGSGGKRRGDSKDEPGGAREVSAGNDGKVFESILCGGAPALCGRKILGKCFPSSSWVVDAVGEGVQLVCTCACCTAARGDAREGQKWSRILCDMSCRTFWVLFLEKCVRKNKFCKLVRVSSVWMVKYD